MDCITFFCGSNAEHFHSWGDTDIFLLGKFTTAHYLMVLFPSIILSPIIRIPGFPIAIRLDDLWMAFGAILLVIYLFKRKNLDIYFPRYARVFLLFIVMFALMYNKLGKVNSNNLNFYNIAARGLMLVYAICMWMSDVFTLLQIMPIVMLVIGLSLNKSVNTKTEKDTHLEQIG